MYERSTLKKNKDMSGAAARTGNLEQKMEEYQEVRKNVEIN